MDCKHGVFSEYGSPRSTAIMLYSMMHFHQHICGQSTAHTLYTIPYLVVSWCLAELGYGLVELRLLLRKVLLVKPKQLLAFSVLLLQA